jgi:hypothetical protein
MQNVAQDEKLPWIVDRQEFGWKKSQKIIEFFQEIYKI